MIKSTKNTKKNPKKTMSKAPTKTAHNLTKHGILNIVEVTAPLVVLACVLLSSNVATPSRLLMVVSFAYAYVSTVMLAGGLVSPFTQTHLRLSLYFLLYHIVGSGFFVLSGGWLLTDIRGEVFAGVAGAIALACGVVHFLHGFMVFVAVLNQPAASATPRVKIVR
ncbi:hypothetical protein IscW_ISCW012903 [Ixodes scapularis]|uniref:Uncharacterized protein n=1 Tax=Ixodes scapularis TaxID=6945 RepID=B7QA95_IXOSC|nr:hypothetical protein IscW_ISCW012903 [Ixodes scapularis]|eukprot:XP_002400129.1 hypothetical protein IscW_ISCW012903 [Ixodes scapularis]